MNRRQVSGRPDSARETSNRRAIRLPAPLPGERTDGMNAAATGHYGS
ncbi:MAG: hypothetical protein WA979_08205 [Pacificimonas sp.]